MSLKDMIENCSKDIVVLSTHLYALPMPHRAWIEKDPSPRIGQVFLSVDVVLEYLPSFPENIHDDPPLSDFAVILRLQDGTVIASFYSDGYGIHPDVSAAFNVWAHLAGLTLPFVIVVDNEQLLTKMPSREERELPLLFSTTRRC